MENFSSGIKLDVDGYIDRGLECVKPAIIEKTSNKKAKLKIGEDGTYLEIGNEGEERVLETAKITLNDCLACSGCVTSAESILITAQSTQEFIDNLKTGKTIVISISPQSRASIAAHFRISSIQAYRKLITFFKKLGANYVFDTSFSREFSLMESAAEFIARKKKLMDAPLPMLASACPGWVCYAEKTHPEVLPHISSTKSPQQIMGTIVKYYLSQQLGITADKIYHAAIMPCFDKKLEASREDFYNDVLETRDVDCVLSSGEILDLIKKENVDFKSLEESSVENMFTNIKGDIPFGIKGSSGGYLEYIFRVAAKELYGITVDKIEYKQIKGQDYQTATLEVNGDAVMTFALAYGFKNIQNVIRNMKQKKKAYPFDFVEVMACPSGCIAGGGQIRPEDGEKGKDLVKRVEKIYEEAESTFPEQNNEAQTLYKSWFDGVFSPDAKTKLHTQYHAREKITNPLAIKW